MYWVRLKSFYVDVRFSANFPNMGGCGAAEGNSKPCKPFSPTQYDQSFKQVMTKYECLSGERVPLRAADVRVVQGVLQADRAEQEGVHVRGRPLVRHRQDAEEALPLLQIPKVSRRRHEAWR